jgi:multimeric flavodoxin WrbA
MAAIRAFGFNCSLKSAHSKEKSSTQALLDDFFTELETAGARGEILRAADFNIKPGVSSDEGDGDAWPSLRKQVVATDILVIGTPIWLGQPSSIAKRVLERMDAFLEEKDGRGRMPSYGKVALCIVVGNEDGAHHVGAEVCQALFEVGFTIPAGGSTYWVGEAMGSKEYKEFRKPPKKVADWNRMLASNTVHLARLLKTSRIRGSPAAAERGQSTFPVIAREAGDPVVTALRYWMARVPSGMTFERYRTIQPEWIHATFSCRWRNIARLASSSNSALKAC